ncbi:hypothetical protein HDV00_010471 [Rhizophlyctis rosea]|nr:hypothetical protein HDV00_010471 [Rhizophlyctis rosea]
MAKDKTKQIKVEKTSNTPSAASKKKKATSATPANIRLAASEQLQSSFRILRTKLLLNLAPVFVGSEQKGAEEYLNRFLMRYVPEVDGVVLSYSDIRPVESAARIIYDSPFFHFHITVTLTLFAPKEKSNLVGVVNKVSPDHIGLLVHGVFNASIPADQIRKNEFQWDDDENCWKRPARDGDPETFVGPESVIRFTVAELIKANDMLTISGSLLLDPHNTGVILNPSIPPPSLMIHEEYEEDVVMGDAEADAENDAIPEPIAPTSPSHSAKRKHNESEADITDEGTLHSGADAHELLNGDQSIVEAEAEQPKKKKRKVKENEEGDNVLGAVPIKKSGEDAAAAEGDGQTKKTKKKKSMGGADGESIAVKEEGATKSEVEKTPKKKGKKAKQADEDADSGEIATPTASAGEGKKKKGKNAA